MDKVKTKKIVNIAVTVLCIVIFIFAAFIVILSLSSRSKGYVNFFGHAYLTVASDSMNGSREESFKKDDLIAIKVLGAKEKENLKVEQVVSFYDSEIVKGKKVINTHRIVAKKVENGIVLYQTQGDAKASPDHEWRVAQDVIGVFEGKATNFGKAVMWIQSSTGNLVCVVIPSILLVMYCIYLVGRSVYDYNKKKLVLVKEEMKQELLKEIKAAGQMPEEEDFQKEKQTEGEEDPLKRQ